MEADPTSSQATGLDGLLRRLRTHEMEKDWRELYAAQAPRLHAVASRLLGDPALAEDAVQEAFLRIRRALRRYQPGSDQQALGWLTTIASRSAIDLQRRGARSERLTLVDPPVPVSGDLDDEARKAVAEALAALPERQRLALLLHVVQGLPHREVGEALHCSERTASSLVHRGLRGLRSHLRRHGFTVPAVALLLAPPACGGTAMAHTTAHAGTATVPLRWLVWIAGCAVAVVLLPLLAWDGAAPLQAAPDRPVAAPPAAAVAVASLPVQERGPVDLAELLSPAVHFQAGHLTRRTFRDRVLPGLAALDLRHLWASTTARPVEHRDEVLPCWKLLVAAGHRLTLEFRSTAPRDLWVTSLVALGPAAIDAVAVSGDEEEETARQVAAIRQYLMAEPGWAEVPVFDLRASHDRSAWTGWTRCFRQDPGSARLEALPPVPANRPEGEALKDDGGANPLGADPRIVAEILLATVAGALADGAERLHLHELSDRAPPEEEVWRAAHSFGLLDASGRPRPSCDALVTLRRLLSAPSGAGRAGAAFGGIILLDEALPADLRSLAIRHHDGSGSVLLWRDCRRWDERSVTAVPIAAAPVSLRHPTPCRWTGYRPGSGPDPLDPVQQGPVSRWLVDGGVLLIRVEP